ncbi:hypothetical protein ACWCPQ_25245 [Nocardia sp. NPDC001965]
MSPTTSTDHDLGWQWLDTAGRPTLHPLAGDHNDNGSREWAWLDDTPPAEPEPLPSGRRRVLAALGVVLATAAIITGAGIVHVTGHHDTRVAAPAPTPAGTPSTTTAAVGAAACEGLTGETVTDSNSWPDSVAGVIAAFEYAYYRHRDASAALRLVAPEAGIRPDALAAGIASIPAGTRHCVAITPLATGVAEVHLAETRPGGHRIDYLQLINLRDTTDGPVITNIQNRSHP